MTDTNAPRYDPRWRNLIILGVIAIIMVGLAALSLWHQASLLAPKYSPETFFPKLATEHRQVAQIHIVSQKYGTVDIVFKPSAGWVLPAEHDYPADFPEVRKTIVGMSGLETIRPQTSRKSWLHYLDLDAPSKHGKGVLVALLDEKGRVIASMIAGKTKDIGEPGTAKGLFVRRPDSDQSWLVRSVFTPKANPKDWMNTDIINIHRAQIQEADIKPLSGPAYKLRRAKPSDADFKLLDMPKGRTLSYPTAPDGVAPALVDFTFNHVAPAHTVDFSDGAQFVTKTFDGLTITANIAKKDGQYWVQLAAAAASGKAEAQKQARKINRAVGGWAFEIPDYKGAQLTSTLQSLLKPEKKARARKRR